VHFSRYINVQNNQISTATCILLQEHLNKLLSGLKDYMCHKNNESLQQLLSESFCFSFYVNLSFCASAFALSLTAQLFFNYSRQGWVFNGEPMTIAEAEFLQFRCIFCCRIVRVNALEKLTFLALVQKVTRDLVAVKSCSE